MHSEDAEYAAESVQRVWRGYLGRRRSARMELTREREKIRSKQSKQHRKSQSYTVHAVSRENSTASDVTPRQSSSVDHNEEGVEEGVVVYKAVKRASRLGSFDKKIGKNLISPKSIDNQNWSGGSESPVDDSHDEETDHSDSRGIASGNKPSYPPAPAMAYSVDDPLISSHLSVIAEEEEMARDSLGGTSISAINKHTLNNLQVGVSNSPKIMRKSINNNKGNAASIVDSLDGPLFRNNVRLEKQNSGRTNSSRTESNDVDTEAEDVISTARTAGATSEADSVEYGQFIKTDRFDDVVATLGDDYNAWDCGESSLQDESARIRDSLHRSKNFSNIPVQATVQHEVIPHIHRVSKLRSEVAQVVASTGDDEDESSGVETYAKFQRNQHGGGLTSRKSTGHLLAFASDGSLSQRIDKNGEPDNDLSSPPREASKAVRQYSPERPFVPSVRDLLAVSPVRIPPRDGPLQAGGTFEDVEELAAGHQRILASAGQHCGPPPSMQSKLEQAQMAYENSVKKNFPVLKPQQPALIIQRSHSRNNSNASSVDVGGSTPRVSGAENSPRSSRSAYSTNAQHLPQQPTQPQVQHGINFVPGPEFPQQIPKQGYFKQAKEGGSQIPLPFHRLAAPLSLIAPTGNGNDQSQGTPRSIRLTPPPNQGQAEDQAGLGLKSKVAPQPLRLTPPPQQAPQGLRRPQPTYVTAGGAGGYAAEYNAAKVQQMPTNNTPQVPPVGVGRFSNLPSKLIPQSLVKPKEPPVLSAVKPTAGNRAKQQQQGMSQTKLTEAQEQKLLEEIEELNRIQRQKIQELAIIEEREKIDSISAKNGIGGAGHQRKASKEIDPVKEKEKRAFKAGAKDLAPVVPKPKGRVPASGAADHAWQDAARKDGVEVHSVAGARNKNGVGHVGRNIRGGDGSQSPIPDPSSQINIHQNLVSKNPIAAAAAAAVVDPSQPNVGGYANVGYLQVYKKKQDVKRGGSNPRGVGRRNSSGDDNNSINSYNNDAQSEGRLFQKRAVAAKADYEETTSLPAIPSSRNIKSSSSARVTSGSRGGYADDTDNRPGGYQDQDQFVHPLDGQNRRVLNASRSNTMSAPSRLHDRSGDSYQVGEDGSARGSYFPGGALPDIAVARANGHGAQPAGMVPVYSMQKNISVQNRGYSKR